MLMLAFVILSNREFKQMKPSRIFFMIIRNPQKTICEVIFHAKYQAY